MTANRGILTRTGVPQRRRSGFAVAWSRTSEPARWLDEVIAEDRRRAGVDTDGDISAPSRVRSRPPLSRAAAGVIGGLCIIIAAQADAALARGNGGTGSGIALRGDGRTSQAAVLGAEGLFPGSTVERTVAVSNRSGAHFDVVALQTVATATSVLDGDPLHGLQLSVDACSVPWRKVEGRSEPSYSCPGEAAPVLERRPVIGEAALAALSATRPGGKDHLRLTLSLPRSADDRFQGQRSRIRYSFKGTVAKAASPRPAERGPT